MSLLTKKWGWQMSQYLESIPLDYSSFGNQIIHRIENPRDFFRKGSARLAEIANVVRSAFGRNLEDDDIYTHVTAPDEVYILNTDESISAMASYNRQIFSGIPCLVVEGIAIAPEFQNKGLFKEITDIVIKDELMICLRTQNPFMYKALQNYCAEIYPKDLHTPAAIIEVRKDFEKHLECKCDKSGILRGYYGGLFYETEPVHKEISPFFRKDLGINLDKGDGILAIGLRNLSFGGEKK